MALAVLVLTHHDAVLLKSHMDRFRHRDIEIFIHVDAKNDTAPYFKEFAGDDNVHFTGPRFSINWGGYNMVLATLELISLARRSGRFDTFLLISGDTVPTIAIEDLVYHLSGRDLISATKPKSHILDRVRRFYIPDTNAGRLQRSHFMESNVDDDLIKNLDRIKDAYHEFQNDDFIENVYYGSQWWSLTSETLDLIEADMRDNPRILRRFEFSAIPDELVFQTFFVRARPKSNRRRGPVLARWNADPLPYVFRTAEDVDYVVQNARPLVRKVDGNSAPFLSALEQKGDELSVRTMKFLA